MFTITLFILLLCLATLRSDAASLRAISSEETLPQLKLLLNYTKPPGTNNVQSPLSPTLNPVLNQIYFPSKHGSVLCAVQNQADGKELWCTSPCLYLLQGKKEDNSGDGEEEDTGEPKQQSNADTFRRGEDKNNKASSASSTCQFNYPHITNKGRVFVFAGPVFVEIDTQSGEMTPLAALKEYGQSLRNYQDNSQILVGGRIFVMNIRDQQKGQQFVGLNLDFSNNTVEEQVMWKMILPNVTKEYCNSYVYGTSCSKSSSSNSISEEGDSSSSSSSSSSCTRSYWYQSCGGFGSGATVWNIDGETGDSTSVTTVHLNDFGRVLSRRGVFFTQKYHNQANYPLNAFNGNGEQLWFTQTPGAYLAFVGDLVVTATTDYPPTSKKFMDYVAHDIYTGERKWMQPRTGSIGYLQSRTINALSLYREFNFPNSHALDLFNQSSGNLTWQRRSLDEGHYGISPSNAEDASQWLAESPDGAVIYLAGRDASKSNNGFRVLAINATNGKTVAASELLPICPPLKPGYSYATGMYLTLLRGNGDNSSSVLAFVQRGCTAILSIDGTF